MKSLRRFISRVLWHHWYSTLTYTQGRREEILIEISHLEAELKVLENREAKATAKCIEFSAAA